MAIRPVAESSNCEEMHATLNKIFNPYPNAATPFVAGVESKEILYPVKYMLNKELYNALLSAALHCGDSEIYLSVVDGSTVEVEGSDWVISLNNDEYFNFHEKYHVMENAVYSPQGKWGIMFYDDWMATIGGQEEFNRVFFDNLPLNRREKYIESYFQQYQHGGGNLGDPDYSYLSIFLQHMYGKDQAIVLMKKYLLGGGL